MDSLETMGTYSTNGSGNGGEKNFLPSLNMRGKWFNAKRELSADDVVLVIEHSRNIPGSDNLIRVVKIRVGNSEYIRPAHRLCPLEHDI